MQIDGPLWTAVGLLYMASPPSAPGRRNLAGFWPEYGGLRIPGGKYSNTLTAVLNISRQCFMPQQATDGSARWLLFCLSILVCLDLALGIPLSCSA